MQVYSTIILLLLALLLLVVYYQHRYHYNYHIIIIIIIFILFIYLLSLIFEISNLMLSDWVLFLTYSNLFEIKHFVVVVVIVAKMYKNMLLVAIRQL
jgi:hypothetical protein